MLIVKCPNCGKDVDFNEGEFRPFCSERCKLLDFGAWADESYSLPAEATSLSEDDTEAVQRAQRDK